MVDFSEMFGTTSASEAEDKDLADGYLTGTKAAADVHKLILIEHKNKSRAFREGILAALREQL